MIYNLIMIIVSIIAPWLIIRPQIKEMMTCKSFKDFVSQYKYEIMTYFLLALGFLLRSVAIDVFPKGLNADEVSSSYEAFSLLNYGIDRNGNSFPVFLKAWGSGQNALYTYLMIPFVKWLGLNVISTRMPMVLIGFASLYVWRKLLLQIKNKKFALIGLAFLSICPWHIMKSRWALESNIFPDLVLWAIYFLCEYLQTNKNSKLYIFIVFLAITAYSYGTAYMFLPIFCIILFMYMLHAKKINIKNTLICFLIVFFIDLPILAYLMINTFDLEQINLGFMTIPKLPVNRYEEQTTLFSGNIISNAMENFKNSIHLLITQNDGLPWNTISGFGIYYLVSIPFFIIGLFFSFKNNKLKNKFDTIINIWFLSAFLLLFVFKEANINRINIVIFPILYYIVNGLNVVLENSKKIMISIILLGYGIYFWGFVYFYVNTDFDTYWTFADSVQEVIEYVNSLDTKKIYMEYAFKEPYIYVLYYTRYDTNEFVNTVKHFNEESLGDFENVKSFGKYYFYLPDYFDEKDCVYVISKKHVGNINESVFKVTEFEKYVVLERIDG